MTTPLRTSLAALILAVALVPAGTADAASKKSKRTANKTAVVKKKRATAKKKPAKPATPAPVAAATETPAPAPVETPTFTSVISIGGFVFHNVS